MPGSERQCGCGRVLAISYPPGLMEQLRSQGVVFVGDETDEDAQESEDPESSGAAEAPTDSIPMPPRAAQDQPVDPTVPRALEPLPIDDGLPEEAEPTEQLSAEDRQRLGVASHERVEQQTGDTQTADDKTRVGAAVPTPDSRGAALAHRLRTLWQRRYIRRLAFAFAGAGVLGIGMFIAGYVYFSKDLPGIEALGNYKPPTVTVVYDRHGELMGEIYEKRRYVIDYEEIPQVLKDAFIAAEDAAFWSHEGVDFFGIIRAVLRNTLKGKKAQGASTITQQVARNFLLTNEKTYTRKIKEMILAGRIEDAFTKEHILYLYLNEIYLGSGAYGVEAASRVYFGKSAVELSLHQAAVLAGLPQRPSDYSPHRHFDKAKARQSYVLEQMERKGYIDEETKQAASDTKLEIVHRTNEFLLKSPYFTEHIRRHIVDTYGFDRVYNEGLIVHSTCDLNLQKTAQSSVTARVEELDRNLGWRGPVSQLKADAIKSYTSEMDDKYRADAAKRLDPTGKTLPEAKLALEAERRYEGVVTSVAKKHAVVNVGEAQAIVPLSKTRWGFTPNIERSWRYRQLNDMQRMLKVGDVLDVDITNADWRENEAFKEYTGAGDGPYAAATIYQRPKLQGALLSYDVANGAVRAMVGGRDFDNSEYNRAVQAKRQVGSTFKPFVYTMAIDSKKFAAGSMLLDAPLTKTTVTEDLWKPGNYSAEYEGQLSLRRALCKSKNVCTVRVLEAISIEPVYEFALRLGIESDMELIDPKCNARELPCMGLSAGLGAGSITMLELARSYSVFPTQGKLIEPYFIEKVIDRDGLVLEAYEVPEPPEVLSPSVAGIGTWLLQQVATAGTGAATNALGLTLGGKTGTTNDHRDGWFMGFSRDVVTATWVGYDQPQSMGVSSTGGRVALPSRGALPAWRGQLAQPRGADAPRGASRDG